MEGIGESDEPLYLASLQPQLSLRTGGDTGFSTIVLQTDEVPTLTDSTKRFLLPRFEGLCLQSSPHRLRRFR